VAGQRLNMGGASAYIDHSDAIGSTTMETDPAGGVQWDIVRYPWGQIWQETGTRPSSVFAGLDWQVNDPLIPSATREYSNNVNRWNTPDPGGMLAADPARPQSWNMYSYVGDNPTSRNDPSGEKYNVCQTDENGNSTDCASISDEQFGRLEAENKNTLTFEGNGKILQSGNLIGTYKQTSVDLSPEALEVAAGGADIDF
jgi:RHS repeat-associated protein